MTEGVSRNLFNTENCFEGRLRLASLVRQIAGGHHEGEEERLVAGVGGVVAGRDHRLQVGADAQVVREVGGWNNPSPMDCWKDWPEVA